MSEAHPLTGTPLLKLMRPVLKGPMVVGRAAGATGLFSAFFKAMTGSAYG
ncbi:Uncharacterised protein [Mycobacteroides abscessus subsp. abscessus]|nr:Uncharacterised protein [Mycobacteroides abscessus subsp. abscessus]